MISSSTVVAGPASPTSPVMALLDSISFHRAAIILFLFLAMTVPNLDFAPTHEGRTFSVDIQTLLRLAICTGCGLLAFSRLGRVIKAYATFPAAWIVLFGIWSLLLVPTSIAPTYSLAAIFANACVMTFIPVAMKELGARGMARALTWSIMFYIVIAWGLYFIVPSIGRGVFFTDSSGGKLERLGSDPQNLGLIITWGVILTLYWRDRGRSWLSLAIPLALLAFSLLMTQSRTSIIACAAIITLYAWRHGAVVFAWLGAIGVAFVVLGTSIGLVPINQDWVVKTFSRSGRSEELTQLTGRAIIWQFVRGRIAERPLTGYGFGCSRHVCIDFNDAGYKPGSLHHAHNIFLNTTLTTGAMGAGLLAMAFLGQGLRSLQRREWLSDSVILAIVLAGIAEPVLMGPMPRAHTILWIVSIFWPALVEEEKRQAEERIKS